ncbi:modular serine protease-like [Drosophila ficusphila]|uniref:modular serine protease-like n=1 Tax=Drosophila ficusphila TaxID=30025 RepID=UPI001C8A484D|nr:modular serine protease-like [Drosophila ficusphila]
MTPLRVICPPTSFKCDNGLCISLGLRCNGRIDCPYDSSDEADCNQISNEIDRKWATHSTTETPKRGDNQ